MFNAMVGRGDVDPDNSPGCYQFVLGRNQLQHHVHSINLTAQCIRKEMDTDSVLTL